MQNMHILFTSILIACGEKDDTATTDTSDTGTTVINTDASFVYDCYNDEGWCDLDSCRSNIG